MRPVFLAAAVLTAAFAAVDPAASAEAPPTVAAVTRAAPSQNSRDDAEQQARWFYSTLTGEIAARTGHTELAYAELLRAARDMQSDALFERVVQVALAAHQPEQALAAVGVWHDTQPGSERAQAWRVQLLLGMGRDADAAPAVARLLAITPQPQRPQTILALGGMFEGMHEPARALAVARRGLAAYASMPQTQAVLGQLQVLSGDVRGGLASAARALQAEPDLRPAALLMLQHYKADPVRADRLLAGYFATRPDDDALRMIWVDSATQQQRDSIALAQCQVLVGHKPHLAQAWLVLGSLYQQLGQARESEQALLRFVELSVPEDAALRRLRAELATAPAGQPPGAAASAPGAVASGAASEPAPAASAAAAAEPGERSAAGESGVSEDDLDRVYLALSGAALDQGALARSGQWLQRVPASRHDAAVVLQRAKLLAAQGQGAQAVALVRALPRGSNAQRRQRVLALAELLQAMHEPVRAWNMLQAGMATWGQDADYAYETAMAADQAGHGARSLSELRRIVRDHPRHQPALNALGYTLAEQGRELDQARRYVERALRLSPGNPFVMDSLAWVEFRAGHLEQAQHLLESAYEARHDAAILAHLAEVVWKRGDRERGSELLRQAWQQAPQDPGVLAAMRRMGVSF